MSRTPLGKVEAGQILNQARVTKGLTWGELADYIDKPLVWTVSALLGKHPVPRDAASTPTSSQRCSASPNGSPTLAWPPTRPSTASTKRSTCTGKPSRN